MKPFAPTPHRYQPALLCALGLYLGITGLVLAAEDPTEPAKRPVADISASSASNPKDIGNQIRQALGTRIVPNKKLTVVTGDKSGTASASTASGRSTPRGTMSTIAPEYSSQYLQARAAALSGRGTATKVQTPAAPAVAPAHEGELHWSYEGENGPQVWGRLQPDFNLCAVGKRQSPILIEEGTTLQGPAEPIQFNYHPSNGTVVNNGHTIQVEVQGDNAITVRNSSFRLVQFHFHTPSEEQINARRFAMVAHLVHQNAEGQLAVVAVLLEPGNDNPLIDKVWTYMPLDAGDRVRMPGDLLNLNELLPADQRYYQYMGSLTTPPCTEGVLWMVLKQPMPISKSQFRLFSQLYPNNARPVQPVNGRPVRDAQ